MIKSFRHKGLKLLFEEDDPHKVHSECVPKIARILQNLDEASEPAAMNLPGFKLHRLKGELADFWAVWVTGNWRVIFRFNGENAVDVAFVDYH